VASTGATGDHLSEVMDDVRAYRAEMRQLTTRMKRLTTITVQSRSAPPSVPKPVALKSRTQTPLHVTTNGQGRKIHHRPTEDDIRFSVAVGVGNTHCANRAMSRSCHGPPRSRPYVGALVGNMMETVQLRSAPATHAAGEVARELPAGAPDAHAN